MNNEQPIKKMHIIVVGCGRLGSALAYRLFRAGQQVAVIDAVATSFNNLPADFNGRFHEGDALSQDVLVRAGIEHADALAAVTSSDAINAVVARIATHVYHIPNVVARNYDPRCRVLFEELQLQVISSTSWGAQRIEEMLYDSDVHTVFSAGNGEVEVYEFVIPSEWKDKTLADLLPGEECLPISITRAGKAMMPQDGFWLQEGDVIHVSATFNGSNCLRQKLLKIKE
ncbi:MAG: TrkA family potassium uptake protein [Bellilinea sp.]|jgi:trk system potassium uptake protein TrkA